MRKAQSLRQAGVPVTYRNYEGVTDEFFGMAPVVGDAKEAQQFVGPPFARLAGT